MDDDTKAMIETFIDARMRQVESHKERIIGAWIAETGLLPSESVLCIQERNLMDKWDTRNTRIWIERKTQGPIGMTKEDGNAS